MGGEIYVEDQNVGLIFCSNTLANGVEHYLKIINMYVHGKKSD